MNAEPEPLMLSTDSALPAGYQGEQGQSARETSRPGQVSNNETANAEGSEGSKVNLAELLAWRAVVYFVNAAETTRTDRAVFRCRDVDDATAKAVEELEERRRTQAHRLGGPDRVRGEAKIVSPDRQTVRRCYLLSEDEAITWGGARPGVDSVVLAHWPGADGKCCVCNEDWPCRTLNQAISGENSPEA